MASPVFNVTRWTLFGTGIAYGFLHDRTLAGKAQLEAAAAAQAKQQELIAQAKAKWAKLHPAPAAPTAAANLDDPNFDPAKWVESQVSQLGQ